MSTLPHGQAWDPELYDRNHGFVTHFGIDLLPLLDPQPGERILDWGCGTGHLTAQIAESGADVIGLDSSPEMVAGARAAYPDLSFQPGDAANFSFATPFDAIFSNAALHWIPTPEAVIACVWRALKPGGRFVAESGGKGNAATLISEPVRGPTRLRSARAQAPALVFPQPGGVRHPAGKHKASAWRTWPTSAHSTPGRPGCDWQLPARVHAGIPGIRAG